MHSKGMVKGMNFNFDSFEFCESCVLGKHARVKFSLNSHRARDILDLGAFKHMWAYDVASIGGANTFHFYR
jgi:hypothetical protein